MQACRCGYQDHRFCPLHGTAMRLIIRAASDHGVHAAEAVSEAFADTDAEGNDVETVCVACVLGVGDHDRDACKGKPAADTPARRAFLAFMWQQPGEDAADVRRLALAGAPAVRRWVEVFVCATKDQIRRYAWQSSDAWEVEKRAELALFEAYLAELPAVGTPRKSTPADAKGH